MICWHYHTKEEKALMVAVEMVFTYTEDVKKENMLIVKI